MTIARAHLVDPNTRRCYHVFSRCVRRAWLCGVDPLTHRSYAHRRTWLEQRIVFLASHFAVALHGYAVMSNHYHLVIELDPCAPQQWSDEQVAAHWLEVCPARQRGHRDDGRAQALRTLLADDALLQRCRQRLGSLSWFMRLINEPLARLANREEDCHGRFWEGRFQSKVLLDDAAWLAAMVYVDLNPLRAGQVRSAEDGPHTSIRRRLRSPVVAHARVLQPIASGLASPLHLPLTLADYRQLLHLTVNRNAAVSGPVPRQLGLSVAAWYALVDSMRRHDRRAFGRLGSLQAYLQTLGQHWLRGLRSAPV